MSIASLYTAVSALSAHQQFMSVVANNLANVNTVGYKSSRVLFADALSQTLKPPTQGGGTAAGSNGAQIGLGTSLGSITPIFSQGALQSTGLKTDLAIQGDGFFVTLDPVSNGLMYTRAGAFNLESSTDPTILGTLVTPTGQRVLGAVVTSPDTTATDGDALEQIDIPTDIGGVAVRDFNIDAAGRVNVLLDDGTSETIYQITLQKFSNPQALQKVGQNLYTASPPSGKIFTDGTDDLFQTPGSAGIGTMSAGYLELSNVDLGQEFSDMIRAQRGLQANSRVITTADEIMQELINLKR